MNIRVPAVVVSSAFLFVLGMGLAVVSVRPSDARAEPSARVQVSSRSIDDIVTQLTTGSFTLTDAAGRVLIAREGKSVTPATLATPFVVAMPHLVEAISGANMAPDRTAALWGFLADDDNAAAVSLELVAALVAKSATPKPREALWSELSAQADLYAGSDGGAVRARLGNRDEIEAPRARPSRARARSLLGLFEDNRRVLLPLLPPVVETEGAGDEMVDLLVASRVFGNDIDESLTKLVELVPGAVARRIGRERDLGKPARWEWQAFERLVAWKDARLVPNAVKPPRSIEDLDAAGDTFITIFNNLHAFDDWYRAQMLRRLGPVEIFNAVVGGELELYRMGTSGYRGMLHAIILTGISQRGSFEAFLEHAAPRSLAGADDGIATRRGMVFIRVASSFGLLEPVLKTVRNPEGFVTDAIASLGDPVTFEVNSGVVLDILMSKSASPAVATFKNALLAKLYDRYRTETSGPLRSVYGSMLSVYQTLTGDHQDVGIGRDFALDGTMLKVPFDRLFSPDGRGGHVHRMFMRMDKDTDAFGTYAGFRVLMAKLGASVRTESHHQVFRFVRRGRTIEIYANKPGPAGMKLGIAAIAEALRDKRVETVIGRGHSSILEPLQVDTRLVLADRLKDVTTVIVGTCGGDASVRDLIGTFGFVRFVTTKATGRQMINNEIIKAYIAGLMAMPRAGTLPLGEVIDSATGPFERSGADEELKDDAGFYQVSVATVLTAQLFDQHVRRFTAPELVAER